MWRKGLRGQNSVFMMADSGAKGNMNQISQMAGMRGLVLDPEGRDHRHPDPIELPRGTDRSRVLPFDARRSQGSRRHRAADGGLRVPDAPSGRRVAGRDRHDRRLRHRAWTLDRREPVTGEQLAEDEFRATILGRVLLSPAVHPETGEVIADRGEELTDRLEAEDGSVRDLVREVMDAGVDKLHVRSVMMCEATHGVCAACYGRNLASGRLVEQGEAVGIIAAQSIGEPGTQLTMRTFHTGGVARADITTGLPRVEELFEARAPKGAAVLADREGVDLGREHRHWPRAGDHID